MKMWGSFRNTYKYHNPEWIGIATTEAIAKKICEESYHDIYDTGSVEEDDYVRASPLVWRGTGAKPLKMGMDEDDWYHVETISVVTE